MGTAGEVSLFSPGNVGDEYGCSDSSDVAAAAFLLCTPAGTAAPEVREVDIVIILSDANWDPIYT